MGFSSCLYPLHLSVNLECYVVFFKLSKKSWNVATSNFISYFYDSHRYPSIALWLLVTLARWGLLGIVLSSNKSPSLVLWQDKGGPRSYTVVLQWWYFYFTFYYHMHNGQERWTGVERPDTCLENRTWCKSMKSGSSSCWSSKYILHSRERWSSRYTV